jgi:hypothetical protein
MYLLSVLLLAAFVLWSIAWGVRGLGSDPLACDVILGSSEVQPRER